VIDISVNADDFGLSRSINRAIVELFEKGLVNSTTIMANMPYFDEAVELAFRNNFNDKVGIHLTLADGVPLTKNILSTDLYKIENQSLKEIRRHLFFITRNERKLIYSEFVAQIERVRKKGIVITHIDTHHHIHEILPVTKIILDLLKNYNIASMRILRNLNQSGSITKKMYRQLINIFIKTHRVNYSDFFGNQLEVLKHLKTNLSYFKEKRIEIMVHPDFNNYGIITDRINNIEYNFEFQNELMTMFKTNHNS
jgi:chitin disaccharide deacetylase